MDEFLKSLVGPALVAIITLAGTWILNNYKIRKEYQVIYEKKTDWQTTGSNYKFIQVPLKFYSGNRTGWLVSLDAKS